MRANRMKRRKYTALIAAVACAVMASPVRAEEMSRDVDSDLFNVAHLMMGEAGYTDSTERRLTASVLLNRVDSDKFPDTIGECLYQAGQYSTVRDGGPFWEEPTDECWADAEDLLQTWYDTGETDLPEDVLYQSRFPQGSGTYLVSGWGQYFCYG
jgi:N-acetylmuramoyl-L-alanine amidase